MVNCRNPCGAFEGHSAAPLKGAAKRDSFGEWQKSMNQWPEHMLHPLDFLRKKKEAVPSCSFVGDLFCATVFIASFEVQFELLWIVLCLAGVP